MPPTVGLNKIADETILKTIWKQRLRKPLRAHGFVDLPLSRDPLEFGWFEWDLDRIIGELSKSLLTGDFEPSRPEVIRVSKGSGLSRPLTFPRVRDHLVYKTLISWTENSLTSAARPWARFGRADAAGPDDEAATVDSGWFRGWLARQAQLWVITGDSEWILESDVANFFPSIDLRFIIDHVRLHSPLTDPCIYMLENILRTLAPSWAYRGTSVVGLPQEQVDCSRILAHAFLLAVDDEFRHEGSDSRYSRWMDDIVIGGDSRGDCMRYAQRLQKSLEQLGLYPNTAKTRIIRAAEFNTEYMKRENDYIGEVQDDLDAGKSINKAMVRKRMRMHVNAKHRLKAWERVLRRYYTLMRHLDSDELVDHALRNMCDLPTTSPAMLEYLRNFLLTDRRLSSIIGIFDDSEGLYDDIRLNIMEYLATCPNDGSTPATKVIEFCKSVVDLNLSSDPMLAAAAMVPLAKFGTDADFDWLAGRLPRKHNVDDVATRQLLVILLGAERIGAMEMHGHCPAAGFETSGHIRFLEALAAGDDRAIGIAKGLLQPKALGVPTRSRVNPRALVLVPLLNRVGGQTWSHTRMIWRKQLLSNPRRRRDRAAERWLDAV